VKNRLAQKNFDFIRGDPPGEALRLILAEKGRVQDMKKHITDQGVLLKETTALPNEIRTALFEMEQGELFGDEHGRNKRDA
jgi:hypothetical protein